ncbi:MAG: peptidylprolyl isomerase [Deltaproteobacteria bacterium]|nr:peptidylprolyl isomerase [Deltaproteobacteria bacterium]
MKKSYGSFFTALLVSCAIALTAGHAIAAEPAQKADKNGAVADASKEVVIRVDKTEITRENYDIAVSNVMPQLSMHGSMSHEKLDKIKRTAIEGVVNSALFQKAAEKEKIEASKKEIDDAIAELKNRLPEGQTLDDVLKNSRMTMSELRGHYKKRQMGIQLQKKKRAEFAETAAALVNEKYLKDYYTKNIEKFKLPEQIHLRSILIKADPSGGPAAWSASLKKAQEIVKMARGDKKTRPKNFAELAKKYSEDPNAKAGGDMGWAHRGEFYEEIDLAAATMKIGDVSEPVSTLYGYHILKLDGIKPAVQKKFSEINKAKLKGELKEKEQKKLREEWLKGLRDAAKIEYVAKDVMELMSDANKDAQPEKDNKTAPMKTPVTGKDAQPGKSGETSPKTAPDAGKDATGKGK